MRLKIIVNPEAGKKQIQGQLERIIGLLLLDGTASMVDVTRTKCRGHATQAAAAIQPNQFDLLIACGGDGTINEVLNGLMAGNTHTPLAILAAGTSNDFAYSMRLPALADNFCNMIRQGNYRDIDIGCANGSYFINVASFGMFTDIAHSTVQESKNVLGRLAYYLQVLKNAPEQLSSSINLSVRSNEYNEDGEYHVCMVANSQSVASLRHLMYKADVSDGKLDVLLLKKKKRPTVADLASPLLRTLDEADLTLNVVREGKERREIQRPGERPRDPIIIYFQTSHIEFSCINEQDIETDLDGEAFGSLPMTIDVFHNAIRLLIPGEDNLEFIPSFFRLGPPS